MYCSTVEFYLSDSNLPFDKFLFGVWSATFHTPAPAVLATPVPSDYPTSALAASTPSPHAAFHLGWLPLDRLTSFKRMQDYLLPAPKGLGSMDAIAAAVTAGSRQVECRTFGEAPATTWYVRRTTELCKTEDAMGRSIYIKGFPAGVDTEGLSDEAKLASKLAEDQLQIELENWVRALGVGQMQSLRMRREGTAFVAGKPTRGKGRGKFKVKHLRPLDILVKLAGILMLLITAGICLS